MDGPTHASLTASAGCWARFGQAVALQYADLRYWPAHQILTDAYMLQHSGGTGQSSVRSAHVHLASLYARVCLGQAEARVIALRRALAAFDFNPFPAWPEPGTSIASVAFPEPTAHVESAEVYATAVLDDWKAHHVLAERLCRV